MTLSVLQFYFIELCHFFNISQKTEYDPQLFSKLYSRWTYKAHKFILNSLTDPKS